jgi:hypothetical protein
MEWGSILNCPQIPMLLGRRFPSIVISLSKNYFTTKQFWFSHTSVAELSYLKKKNPISPDSPTCNTTKVEVKVRGMSDHGQLHHLAINQGDKFVAIKKNIRSADQ